MNFERPFFKLLKNIKADESAFVESDTTKQFNFQYECDGSLYGWNKHLNLVPHVFLPAQYAFIYNNFLAFPHYSEKLPSYINQNEYLLLCNVLFENRKYIKINGKIKFHKLGGKMRWNLSALEGLFYAVNEARNSSALEIEIDARFASKLKKLKENNKNK